MAQKRIQNRPTNSGRDLPGYVGGSNSSPNTFYDKNGVAGAKLNKQNRDQILSNTDRQLSDIDQVLADSEAISALKELKMAESSLTPEMIKDAASNNNSNPIEDFQRRQLGIVSPRRDLNEKVKPNSFKPIIGSPENSSGSSNTQNPQSSRSSGSSQTNKNEAKSLSDIINNDRLNLMAGLEADANDLKKQKVGRFNIRGRARKRARLIALGLLLTFATAIPLGAIAVIPHAIQNWIGNRVSDYTERAAEKVGQRMVYSYLKNRVAIEKCNDYYNNVVNVNSAASSALGKSACRPRMGEREGRVKQLFDDWKSANMEDLLAKNGIAIEYNADSTNGGDRLKPYSLSIGTVDGERENLRLSDDITSVDWDQGNFLGRRTASIDIRRALNDTLKNETNWWQYLKRRNLKAGYLRSLDLPSRIYTPRALAEKQDNIEAYKDLKVSKFKQNLVKHVINSGDGRVGAFIEILLEGNGKNKMSKNELEGTIKGLRRDSANLSDEKIAQMVKRYAGKDLSRIGLEATTDLVNKLLKKIGKEIGQEALESATKAIPIIGQIMLAAMILDLIDLATDGTLQKYLSVTNAQSMLEVSNLMDTVTSEEKRGFVDAQSVGDMRLSLINGLGGSRVFANTIGYESPSDKKAAGYDCKPKISVSDLESIFDQVGNVFTSGNASAGEQTGMAEDQDTCENHRVDYDPINSLSGLFGLVQGGVGPIGLDNYTEKCIGDLALPGLDLIGQLDGIIPGSDICPSAQEVYHGANGGIEWLFGALQLTKVAEFFANLPPFKWLVERSNQYFANAFSIAVTGNSLAGKELLQGGLSGEAKSGARIFDAWSGGQQVMNNQFAKGVGEGGGLGATALSSQQAAKLNKTIAMERREELKTASIFDRFFDLSEPDTLASTALVTVFKEGSYQNYVNPLTNLATLFNVSTSPTYASSPEQEYCSDVDQFGRAVTEFGVVCYGITDESIDSLTDEQIEQYGDPEFCESFTSGINARNGEKESEEYYVDVGGASGAGRNPNQDSDGSAINTDFDPCRLICTSTDALGTFARTDDPICGFEDLGEVSGVSSSSPDSEPIEGALGECPAVEKTRPNDGKPRNDVEIQIVPGTTIDIRSDLCLNVLQMVEAASSDGVSLNGGGFRTYDEQVALRRSNCGPSNESILKVSPSACRPPTARPGTSNHEDGTAIDFENCSARSTACYIWLSTNAARFGFKNLPSEPWHWSTSGG
jgi:hypothetical protein